MGLGVGRPLAKAVNMARGRLRGAPAAAAPPSGADLVSLFEENSPTSKIEVERLLARLPSLAFKGRRVNSTQKPICAALVEKFQSLGENCEFGFVQRLFGAEPLDLFRFAALSPQALARALQSRLVELEHPETLALEFDGEIEDGQPHFATVSHDYGIRFHAGRLPVYTSFDELKLIQMKKLKLLSRKFLEDLEESKRIFVCKCEASERPYVERLLETMRTFGPATVLWVTREERGKPAGTVEYLGDGLMRGYIDRFALPNRIWIFSGPLWLKLCCEAYRLHINQPTPVLP